MSCATANSEPALRVPDPLEAAKEGDSPSSAVSKTLDRMARAMTYHLDCSMDDPNRLPDVKNAMEWESGRPAVDERFDFVIFICRCGIPGGPELPLPQPWYGLGK